MVKFHRINYVLSLNNQLSAKAIIGEKSMRIQFKLSMLLCFLMVIVVQNQAYAIERYEILPGDVVQISVWNEEELAREVLVRPDGAISFPLAGDIETDGKTAEEVRAEIATKLEKYIPEAEVNVAVESTQGNRAYVLGKVARPGPILMSQDTDVMQAISVAGGTTTFAKLKKIIILRRDVNGNEEAIPFNYKQVEKGEDLETNIILQKGDVVVVP